MILSSLWSLIIHILRKEPQATGGGCEECRKPWGGHNGIPLLSRSAVCSPHRFSVSRHPRSFLTPFLPWAEGGERWVSEGWADKGKVTGSSHQLCRLSVLVIPLFLLAHHVVRFGPKPRVSKETDEPGRDGRGEEANKEPKKRVSERWQDGTEDLRNRPFTRHILHPTSASLSHPLPSARSGLPSPPYRFAQRMTWEWGTRWKCYAWNGQSISGSVWSRLCPWPFCPNLLPPRSIATLSRLVSRLVTLRSVSFPRSLRFPRHLLPVVTSFLRLRRVWMEWVNRVNERQTDAGRKWRGT